jgi:hypothetical protein
MDATGKYMLYITLFGGYATMQTKEKGGAMPPLCSMPVAVLSWIMLDVCPYAPVIVP